MTGKPEGQHDNARTLTTFDLAPTGNVVWIPKRVISHTLLFTCSVVDAVAPGDTRTRTSLVSQLLLSVSFTLSR
jgi:hypothetical protein